MRKPPGCRIRIEDAGTETVRHALNSLIAAGAIAGWKPTIYEPETTAFGGPVGMGAAHELFCADTRGLLTYLRQPNPPIGRRELSVLLVSAMLAAAGLDWFERGDVFARVAAMRPAPEAGTDVQRAHLTEQLGTLLAVPASSTSPLFGPEGSVASAAPWLAAFEVAGHRFADAVDQGYLNRGIRAVLAHVVIFHWNRLGLSASTQAILASAATDAYLPKD
jgi:thiopeptide-type bacteriocin biosynthesis protein